MCAGDVEERPQVDVTSAHVRVLLRKEGAELCADSQVGLEEEQPLPEKMVPMEKCRADTH